MNIGRSACAGVVVEQLEERLFMSGGGLELTDGQAMALNAVHAPLQAGPQDPQPGATLLSSTVGDPIAYIDGLKNDDWEGGICYLASLGQMLQYLDPTLDRRDILLRSGMLTQGEWVQFDVDRFMGYHPRAYDQGAVVDLMRLLGVGYHVAYGKGGGGGYGWTRAADTVTTFKSAEQATAMLKGLIDQGKPVQVHVDFQYLREEAAAQMPFWANFPAGEASSHFFVVHGYDDQYIYYTDNGPVDHEPGGQKGVGMHITWASFLAGWQAAGGLTQDRHQKCGPYFMSWLANAPTLSDEAWTLQFLAEDAQNAPNEFRQAADAFRGGTPYTTLVTPGMRERYAQMRQHMADYLTDKGYAAIAALYQQSADKWDQMLALGAGDYGQIPGLLDEIADIEEQAHDLMGQIAGGEGMFTVVAPGDGQTAADLANAVIRYVAKPSAGAKVFLEISLDGTFTPGRNLIRIAGKAGQSFVKPSLAVWKKIVTRVGETREISYRIVQAVRNGQAGATQTLAWDEMSLSASAPIDGADHAVGTAFVLNYSLPVFTGAARLIFSATNDFSDPRRLYSISLSPRASTLTVAAKTMAKVLAKTASGPLVYWRLVDAKMASTLVAPSATCTLNLV